MIDDLNTLAIMAASLMERIEADYGDDIQIRTIAICVEVDLPDRTNMIVSSSDDRPWVQIAFLEQALTNLEALREAAYDEDAGEDE